MKIMTGLPCSEFARYSVFYDSLVKVKGYNGEDFCIGRGANVAENRNGIVERALQRGYDAIWFIDDDHTFHPETLNKLIAQDKDVVSGLYVSRQPPFVPQVYDREDERGHVRPYLLQTFRHGLLEAKAVGAGCLLVKCDVFRKLEKPWWTLGQYDKVGWSDDVDFCRRVRAAGYKVYCDLSNIVGHEFHGTVWPYCEHTGEWSTRLVYGGSPEPVAIWPAAAERPREGIELP